MEKFEEFKNLINSGNKNIVITTHYKPDADALGSSLALADYLQQKNHTVTVITPSDYPDFLFWMNGNDDVVIYDKMSTEFCEKAFLETDIIFCLDFSALHRIFGLKSFVEKSPAVKVLIDHHQEPEKFADFEYWNENAAATAELVFELICMMGDKDLINIDMAEALYAGIMTDTGSFRFASTSSRIHHIIAELIDIGADNAKIHQLIYDTNHESKLRLLGHILSKNLFVLPQFSTAYIVLPKKDLYKFNAKTGDTEGIVNYALSIKGIKFATLMKESEGIVKLSFRSIGDFAVSEFSKNHFSGGGHKNAAGGRSELSLKETEQKFLNLLPAYKSRIC